MKITNLNSGYFYGLLNEANVLNAKKTFEYGNPAEPDGPVTSIERYLEHYLQYLGEDKTKEMFVKKLSKLLANDERYLNHVRRFEPGMPEWAKKAIMKKELVYFQPEGELNEMIEHLTHYLNALETNMKSPDNNIVAFSKKEYDGFIKAENLKLLEKKSQEYFKRGSKKATKSEEGMDQIADYSGWKWFIMRTAEAFEREGKTLQNCFGDGMTPASVKAEGLSILIMRKPNGESVVAASVNNKKNYIDEIKGKNNKPPVEKYMPYVLQFLNDPKYSHLDVAERAERNFKEAGYFWIKKKMYSRAEVIKKFIKKDIIAKLPDGNSLVKVSMGTQNKWVGEIFEEIYKQLSVSSGYGSSKTYKDVYEFRNDQDLPLVSGAIDNKKLESIQRYKTLRERARLIFESVLGGKVVKEFVGELMRRGIINSINDKMTRDLFWNERVQINRAKGVFEPVNPKGSVESDDEEDTKKNKGKVVWEKHVDTNAVKMIKQSVETSQDRAGSSGKWEKIFGGKSPKKGVVVYITKEKLLDTEHDKYETDGKFYAMVKRPDDILVPIMVHVAKDRVSTVDVGNAKDTWKRLKMIRAAIALANKENLKLGRSFAYNNGIVFEKGKYKEFDWKARAKKISPEITKIDLNGIPPGDRMNAISMVLVTGKIRYRGDDDEHDTEDKIWKHDLELQLKLDYMLEGKKYVRNRSVWSQPSQEETSNWRGFDPDKVYRQIYNGKEPNAIWLVMVNYGKGKKHQVLMVADDRHIMEIDGVTERHDFQNWGDHELVSAQLNDFAKEQGLIFDQEALSGSEELHVYKGKVGTEAMINKAKLQDLEKKGEIGGEGVDRVEFKDGTYMVRMEVDEQAQWVRKGLGTGKTKKKESVGQGWAVVDKNKYLGIVIVKNNTVQAIYGPKFDWDSDKDELVAGTSMEDMASRQSLSPELVSYIVAAKTHFGWKAKATAQLTIKKGSKEHKILKTAIKHGDTDSETKELKRVTNLGLVKSRKIKSGGYRAGKIKVTATPFGKQAATVLDKKDSVNVLSLKSKAKIV
jgi:hypothetical protein